MKTQKNYILKYILFPVVRIVLWVYIFFGVFLYFMQSSILYHPSQRDFFDCPELDEDFEKLSINGTRFYYRNLSDDGVLIHYHGNAWRACDRALKQDMFESSWRSIIIVEYSGYGWDTINPSKQNILQNTHDIADFITETWYSDVFIYWESLWSTVASYHASHSKVNKLILVSPFTSVADVATEQYSLYPVKLLLRENYTTQEWLQDFSQEVTIFHGTSDTIISPHFSKKLYTSLQNTDSKEYYSIENYGHNDIWFSQDFIEIFWENIRQ